MVIVRGIIFSKRYYCIFISHSDKEIEFYSTTATISQQKIRTTHMLIYDKAKLTLEWKQQRCARCDAANMMIKQKS